jgi:hypothetical protein
MPRQLVAHLIPMHCHPYLSECSIFQLVHTHVEIPHQLISHHRTRSPGPRDPDRISISHNQTHRSGMHSLPVTPALFKYFWSLAQEPWQVGRSLLCLPPGGPGFAALRLVSLFEAKGLTSGLWSPMYDDAKCYIRPYGRRLRMRILNVHHQHGLLWGN